MNKTVLVFLIDQNKEGKLRLCLGKRKASYAHGMWNAPGGKVKLKEDLFDAAAREVKEETGLKINKKDLKKRAEIIYYESTGNCIVNVFVCRNWRGKLVESSEIVPRWFSVDRLPYEKMWENDRLWWTDVLSGKNIKGKIWNDENNKVIKSELKEVNRLS